jgi:hypothetical protein
MRWDFGEDDSEFAFLCAVHMSGYGRCRVTAKIEEGTLRQWDKTTFRIKRCSHEMHTYSHTFADIIWRLWAKLGVCDI